MAGLAHFAPGFAAKRFAPGVPVIMLVLAGEFLDFLALGLGLAGLEPVNGGPFWSHSLFMAIVWSLLAAGVTALVSRKPRSSLVLGLVVLSHWVLDAIAWPMTAINPLYASGMPLFMGATPNIGFGLYRTVFGVILGEGVFMAACVALYIVWLVKYKKEKKAAAETRD
jgi:hypothetical protein